MQDPLRTRGRALSLETADREVEEILTRATILYTRDQYEEKGPSKIPGWTDAEDDAFDEMGGEGISVESPNGVPMGWVDRSHHGLPISNSTDRKLATATDGFEMNIQFEDWFEWEAWESRRPLDEGREAGIWIPHQDEPSNPHYFDAEDLYDTSGDDDELFWSDDSWEDSLDGHSNESWSMFDETIREGLLDPSWPDDFGEQPSDPELTPTA